MNYRTTVVLIAGWMTGCAVGPNYQRPAVQTPQTFRAPDPLPAPQAESFADLKWWEVFRDADLQQLIRTAIEQNYDLREAVARVESARANLGITRSDQFPQVGVSGDLQFTRLSRNGSFRLPGSLAQSQNRNWGEASLARLSQTRTSFSHGEGCTSRPDAPDSLDERSAGIQRPRSKILTDLRCSAVSSGARITVARRPRSFVRTRTKVAFTSESVFIMLCADFLAPSVRRTRLTNVKPITVAKVCNRKELSAHWCEGPQGATPPFFARRNSSSTFHCPRKACTIRPLLQT